VLGRVADQHVHDLGDRGRRGPDRGQVALHPDPQGPSGQDPGDQAGHGHRPGGQGGHGQPGPADAGVDGGRRDRRPDHPDDQFLVGHGYGDHDGPADGPLGHPPGQGGPGRGVHGGRAAAGDQPAISAIERQPGPGRRPGQLHRVARCPERRRHRGGGPDRLPLQPDHRLAVVQVLHGQGQGQAEQDHRDRRGGQDRARMRRLMAAPGGSRRRAGW
jgi:hypothetical protein